MSTSPRAAQVQGVSKEESVAAAMPLYKFTYRLATLGAATPEKPSSTLPYGATKLKRTASWQLQWHRIDPRNFSADKQAADRRRIWK